MSSRGKTVASELPGEVKEMILERMPTRDAARCALLSTQWRDAWYRQGRLVFDRDFFRSLENMSKAGNDDGLSVVSIINQILMLRAGLVKKFTFYNCFSSNPPLKQSDLDRWCLLLSRKGVEELHLSGGFCITKYKFSIKGLVFSMPKLEKLDFFLCFDTTKFVASAPNLQSLSNVGST
ncbi:unnamed protein product [Cuscuta europaea]|uniref:F-box domain-containing protein n=1 Tax=Cuscuta europaea TaxID=41803 RepID=A0A9P0ZYG3_CUSEU|nr:unnamed protein product [Cuscuta europaea]